MQVDLLFQLIGYNIFLLLNKNLYNIVLGLILVSIGRIARVIRYQGDVCDFLNQHKQA